MSVLQKGDEGSEVKVLQSELSSVGCACTVDGIFGAATEQAVKNFQRAFALADDGIVGQGTRAALKKALADAKTNANS